MGTPKDDSVSKQGLYEDEKWISDSNDPDTMTKDQTHSSSAQSQESTLDAARALIGSSTVSLTDAINNNLLAVRYGAAATVGLLTAYGLSQTPLFFRYTHVADIPSWMFRQRRSIHGRLTAVDASETSNIRLHIRHLSPIERLLSQTLYDQFWKWNPNDASPLIVDLAAVESPPVRNRDSLEWLERLSAERPVVRCQLLARRSETAVVKDGSMSDRILSASSTTIKREIPGLETVVSDKPMIAIGRVYYRPEGGFQLFAKDLSASLVERGRATVASSLYGGGGNKVQDATEELSVLRKDVTYMESLSALELHAASAYYGLWSDSEMREKRKDVTEEAEFQATATWWQKLWRRWRG